MLVKDKTGRMPDWAEPASECKKDVIVLACCITGSSTEKIAHYRSSTLHSHGKGLIPPPYSDSVWELPRKNGLGSKAEA